MADSSVGMAAEEGSKEVMSLEVRSIMLLSARNLLTVSWNCGSRLLILVCNRHLKLIGITLCLSISGNPMAYYSRSQLILQDLQEMNHWKTWEVP